MKVVLVVFFFIVASTVSRASTFITACQGEWSDPNTWKSNTVPSFNDSILIYHSIYSADSLTFDNNYVYLDSSASFCVLKGMFWSANSEVITYGFLEFTYLHTKAVVKFNGPVIFSILLKMTGGSVSFSNKGSANVFDQDCPHYPLVHLEDCDSVISPSGNKIWKNSGKYLDTLQSVAGCDSVIAANVRIHADELTVLNKEVCYEYLSPSGNYTWNSTGIYMDTLTSYNLCDSILEINLQVNGVVHGYDSISTCEEFMSPSGNQIWNVSGSYMDTIPSVEGCDSALTVELTIHNKKHSYFSDSTCQFAISPWYQEIVYSGSYTHVLETQNGCDSILHFDVVVDECDCLDKIPNVFTPNGDGVNDFFFPQPIDEWIFVAGPNCTFPEYQIEIYNRWGLKVFESDYYFSPWFGKNEDVPCSEGTYFYKIEYVNFQGVRHVKSGYVKLQRF